MTSFPRAGRIASAICLSIGVGLLGLAGEAAAQPGAAPNQVVAAPNGPQANVGGVGFGPAAGPAANLFGGGAGGAANADFDSLIDLITSTVDVDSIGAVFVDSAMDVLRRSAYDEFVE